MPKAKNNVVRELVSRYRALRGFSLVPEEYLTASPYTLSNLACSNHGDVGGKRR